MTLNRRIAPAVAFLAAAALMAACGSGEGPSSSSSGGNGEAAKTAAQIVKDAEQATAAATTVHIAGKGTSDGTALQLDIVAGHGHGGGTISENGLSFQTVLDGKTVFMQADAATWTKLASASAARLLAGKWIKTTTDNQDLGQLAGILDISKLVSQFTQPSGTITKGKVTSVNGVPVVPVTDHGSDGGVLDVADTGAPHIVAISATGSNHGTIYFSQYGTAKIPPDPQGAIDLSQLEGGG